MDSQNQVHISALMRALEHMGPSAKLVIRGNGALEINNNLLFYSDMPSVVKCLDQACAEMGQTNFTMEGPDDSV